MKLPFFCPSISNSLRILFLLLIGFLLVIWLSHGSAIYAKLTVQSPEQYVSESIDRLRKSDPSAALALERLKEERGVRALAATLRASEAQGDSRDSALRRVAATSHAGMTDYNTRLVALADKAQLMDSGNDLEDFLDAHATTCQFLAHDPSGNALNFYLEQLEKAREQPKVWQHILRDPVGLLIWPSLSHDPELWNYYVKNSDWLGEVLTELSASNLGRSSDATDDRSKVEKTLVDAVRTARDFDPLPRKAVEDLKLGAAAFNLFLRYGKVIKLCTTQSNIPLAETLDVIFVNPDFAGKSPTPSDEELAASLIYIHHNKPKVWTWAQRHPMVLRLNRDAPNHADELLEKFGADGITEFLYTSYEKEIAPATECLTRFGELGWYVLGKYADDPRIHIALNDKSIGFRIVPFLLHSGDKAFDKLAEDKRWINEYFDADGTPKTDDNAWLTAVPLIGAPAVVVKKKWQGRPLEWSELGWAAVDIADDVLLVISLGGSAELVVLEEGAKKSAEIATKAAFRKTIKESALKSVEGARGVARVEEELGALSRFARATGRAARGAEFVIVGGARAVRTSSKTLWRGVKQVERAWATLPPADRKWVYRGALAVGLLTTLCERTLPNFPAFADKVGEELGNMSRQVGKGTARGIAGFARGALGLSPTDQVKARIVFWVVAAVLTITLLVSGWRATRSRSVRLAA